MACNSCSTSVGPTPTVSTLGIINIPADTSTIGNTGTSVLAFLQGYLITLLLVSCWTSKQRICSLRIPHPSLFSIQEPTLGTTIFGGFSVDNFDCIVKKLPTHPQVTPDDHIASLRYFDKSRTLRAVGVLIPACLCFIRSFFVAFKDLSPNIM